MNTVFKLEINNPAFDEEYNKYKKLSEIAAKSVMKLDEIKEILRIQLNKLITEQSFNIGRLIITEEHIFKPLNGVLSYVQISNGIQNLLSDGYLNYYPEGKDRHMGYMLTTNGYKWAENSLADITQQITESSKYIKYNYFSIPEECSPKIKKLLGEINDLPGDNTADFYNLIAHQLRTILALSLIEYWKNGQKPLDAKNKSGLRDIINYTVKYSQENKLNQAKYIVGELQEIKQSKAKELIDDVVHCNYSLIADETMSKLIPAIKHLLSLIYRR